MITRKALDKFCNLVMNLRAVGIDGANEEDIQAATGELSNSDLSTLAEAMLKHGAYLQPNGIYVFSKLNVEALRATKIEEPPPYKVVFRKKVPAGEWQKDSSGRLHFVPDPNFKLPE